MIFQANFTDVIFRLSSDKLIIIKIIISNDNVTSVSQRYYGK